jgi:hypothetical protein
MKRITEAQIRQVVREELHRLLNEVDVSARGPIGIGVMRTPAERAAEGLPRYLQTHNPDDPVVDPRFFSEPMNILEEYDAFSFFNKLEKPFLELKKIFQIDEKDSFEANFIRSLNLLKIDYDSYISYNKRRKDLYNKDAKLLIILEDGKLYLAVPEPEADEEYQKIEIKQKQFDIIKRLLEKR